MFDELVSPLFSTQWGRRSGVMLLGFMLFLIVLMFFQMIWEWRSDVKLATLTEQQNNRQAQAESQLAELINHIPEWHLYGKYGVVSKAESLPVTSLQIKLVGVIKATPDSKSRVIISEENGPGKVYQVGDTLPSSGVKINSITKDGVILENSGRLENLPLQRKPLQFKGLPQSMLGE